jgi:hypothetical protein
MIALRRLVQVSRLRMTDGQPVFPRIKLVGQAALVLTALLYATWLLHVHFFYAHISQRPLSLAVAFLCMQTIAISIQLAISFSIKRRGESIEERAARTQPVIREHLAAHVSGENRTPQLSKLSRRYPDQVEICVVEALGAVQGYGRDRVSALASDMGLLEVWKKRLSSRYVHRRKEAVEFLGLLGRSDLQCTFETRLTDPDLLVRAAAVRSLLDLDQPDTARLFQMAIEGPLLLRALVAGDLRKHSVAVSRRGLPESLFGNEQPGIIAGLGVVEAWGRSLRVPEVAALTFHASLEVRVAAIRSLAFVEATRDTESLILAALEDTNSEIRVAAMHACSQRRMQSSIPSLQRELRSGDAACMPASCQALAMMGEEGWGILEECVLSPDRALAAEALSALAAARVTAGLALVAE